MFSVMVAAMPRTPPAVRRYVEQGKRLAAFRKLRKLKPSTAARAGGLDPNYWSKIESGKAALAKYSNRKAVAEALGIDMADLDALWAGEVGPRTLHKRLSSAG
jgi:transcriptional regulator with XRE-family HTH domain